MASGTREAVLKATIALFNELGPMVPMSEISRRAGVAAGTPFRYFPTKQALLLEAYREAHRNSLEYVPPMDFSRMTPEEIVKGIVRTIVTWSVLCPDDLEYMRKYEDTFCYDCFSDRFSEELYVGIIREHNLWPKLAPALRPDLPEAFVNRMLSFNCSVYSRYVVHSGLARDSEAFQSFDETAADSVWNSLKRC